MGRNKKYLGRIIIKSEDIDVVSQNKVKAEKIINDIPPNATLSQKHFKRKAQIEYARGDFEKVIQMYNKGIKN